MASPTPSAGDGARARLVEALAAVAGGDRKALKTVYDLTSAKLMGVCLRICQDREAAEDVMQDVYMKVWDRAGRFDASRASPITWLCTIARNTAIDWRRARGLGETAPVEAALALPDGRPSAEALLEAGETQARIFDCLEALEEKPRGAIRAAFFQGRTYPELAAAAAVPLGTMKSWIRRGLIQLRGCLGDG
ncbi:sigma-70 family RNA polymerase sigma factor [Sphingomonas sp.]|uniref:sigma-70 family RNA polymerase sigma factor n=1 Tax=Sphingomonas sp. TaxID=28214 RepID=UPI0028A98F5A|nr:sigma-70 family RNA polymerase sigma factor [Sphingomonas sp.]